MALHEPFQPRRAASLRIRQRPLNLTGESPSRASTYATLLRQIRLEGSGLPGGPVRVLPEGEFQRLGVTHPIPLDLRVIERRARDRGGKQGFERAAVVARIFRIQVPLLRERREDILALVKYFIDRYPRNAGRKIRSLERRTLESLLAYDSQVDIRELQNVVVRAVILSDRETSQSTKRGLSSKSREHPRRQSLIRLCLSTRNAK